MKKNSKESDPTQKYEKYSIGYGDPTQPKNKIQSNASRYTEDNVIESGSREIYTISSLPSEENDR